MIEITKSFLEDSSFTPDFKNVFEKILDNESKKLQHENDLLDVDITKEMQNADIDAIALKIFNIEYMWKKQEGIKDLYIKYKLRKKIVSENYARPL